MESKGFVTILELTACPPPMAVGASHHALLDLLQDCLPSIVHPCHHAGDLAVILVTPLVVELQNDGIAFAAVNAWVRLQILEKQPVVSAPMPLLDIAPPRRIIAICAAHALSIMVLPAGVEPTQTELEVPCPSY